MTTINLNEIDDACISFVLTSMLKSAAIIKRNGYNETKYQDLCTGVWETLEINDLEELENILHDKMRHDINQYLNNEK